MKGVVKINWSRESRKKLKLLEPDPQQQTITSYFEIVNEIEMLAKQNIKLNQFIWQITASHEDTALKNEASTEVQNGKLSSIFII